MENVPKKKEKRKYSAPAVENAFAILRLLSRKRFQESTVTEIANALSLNVATCYRILQILEELSVVRYLKEKKRYTLGPYLVVLGERAKEHLDYTSIIIPYLQEITEKTGMTSILVNRIGEDKLAITAKEEATNNFGISASVGRHFSIIDGSYGMCFLAYMDKEERDYHLQHNKGLKTFSQEEIDSLEVEFEKIRSKGFYVTYGEFLKGICGISSPIFNLENKVEMCITLIGLTANFEKSDLELKGQLVKEIADKITHSFRSY